MPVVALIVLRSFLQFLSRRPRGPTVGARVQDAPELRDLLAFYQSPLGKRLLEVQPDLTRDAMLAGQKWGMQLGAEIGQELAAEGIQIQP